ncbi:hypothetical protein Gotri_015910 [Gossypium trilobum]|uniref:Uncharacterized protein n=1 Tax=Gossypium trilobum TaxID=34281 RepID=A0A7J9E1N0_9ROSI|nr:hypothetical protein [Gossypium trilobum]
MGIDQEENSGRGEVVAETLRVPLSDLVSSLVELITSQVEQGSIQDGRRSLESRDLIALWGRPSFTWHRERSFERFDQALGNIAWVKLFPNLHTYPSDEGQIISQEELDSILHREELLRKQKARYNWLNLRDRNNRFFHSRTLQRRKANSINALRNQKLYGELLTKLGDLPPSSFPQLGQCDKKFLGKLILDEEIKSSHFDMAPRKAPGNDGFHALFFQNQ